MIEIKNINKYYKKGKSQEIHVINNTSLKLEDKGLVVLLGHSGSGKTTLLNVIGGLDKAKGDLIFDDIKIHNYQAGKIDELRNKYIGYIFQNYNLILDKTVSDNIKEALEIYGINDLNEIKKRTKITLEAVGLYKYRFKQCKALSGGQMQRVSIARALVKNPKIIIADEPTGNLDRRNTIDVMNILSNISKKCLVLLVTHNEDIARFYGDRIINISDGRVINDNINEKTSKLDMRSSNNIYLGDLNKESINNLINIDLFYDDKKPKFNLDIIYKNGSLYINTQDKNVKYIGINSDVILLPNKYEELKQENVVNDFDLSSFNNTKGKKNPFKKLLSAFINSFAHKKRTKLLYLAFALLGMFIAFDFYNLSKICDSNYAEYLVVDENAIVVLTEDLDKLMSNYDFLNYDANIFKVFDVRIPIEYMEFNNNEVIKGNAPTKFNEMAISEGLADFLLKRLNQYHVTENKLIGMEISDEEDNKCIISGIIKSKSEVAYVDKSFYKTFFNALDNSYGVKNEYTSYNIVAGRDVMNDDEVILNIKNFNAYSFGEYKIVGYFDQSDYSAIFNSPILNIEDDYVNKYGVLSNFPYEIIEGTRPEKNEVLVSDIFSNSIGEIVKINDIEYLISGKYHTDKYFQYSVVFNKVDRYKHLSVPYVDILNQEGYLINGDDSTLRSLWRDGFYADYQVNLAKMEYQMNNKESIKASIISIIITTIIIFIFTFFLMRSKMISQIYNIGVYRALGKKKIHFIFDNIIEIVALTTITTVVGYSIMMYVIFEFSKLTQSVSGILFLYYALGLIFIYLCSILIGLIPIILLLRKTPSEILTKYDI